MIKENIFLIDLSTAWILNTVKTSLNEKVLKYLVEKQFKKVELSENTLVYTTFKTCNISIKL